MKTVSIYGKEFLMNDQPADMLQWLEEGRYDQEWRILEKFLRPEHTFIDLGAWIGTHSLFASSITTRVISVEPDPVAFDILKKNLALNGNIVPDQIAITGNIGTITLGSGFLGASTTRANRDAGAGIGAWEPGHQFDISCTTLRQFIIDKGVEGPMFIKMDVEGSEEQILKDLDFFREHKPVLYLECHPFWWRNEADCWSNIREIAGLYSKVLNIQMNPVDLITVQPRSLILCDA